MRVDHFPKMGRGNGEFANGHAIGIKISRYVTEHPVGDTLGVFR